MLSEQVRNLRGRVRLGVLATLVVAFAVAGVLVWLGPAAHRSLVSSNMASVAQEPGTTAVAGLAEQATQRTRELTPDPVLRQVDVDPVSGRLSFYSADAPATVEVDVLLPSPAAPPGRWQVTRPAVSKLVGYPRPGLELRALRVGPADATRPMTARWPGCVPRSLTLYGERDALTWYAACTLPDGRVAVATVDGRSGAFRPSPAPSAPPPPTAAPSR